MGPGATASRRVFGPEQVKGIGGGTTLRLSSTANAPRGIATPSRNPPKTAWMPTASIRNADTRNRAGVIASTVMPIPPSRRTARPGGASGRGPARRTTAAQATPPPIASGATPGPPPKVASAIASTHRDQTSSNAPAVSDGVPAAPPLGAGDGRTRGHGCRQARVTAIVRLGSSRVPATDRTKAPRLGEGAFARPAGTIRVASPPRSPVPVFGSRKPQPFRARDA